MIMLWTQGKGHKGSVNELDTIVQDESAVKIVVTVQLLVPSAKMPVIS